MEKDELVSVNIELRKLSEAVKDGSVGAEDAEKKLTELRSQKPR